MQLGSRQPMSSAYNMKYNMPVIEEDEVCAPRTPLRSPRPSPLPNMGEREDPYPRYPPPAYSAGAPLNRNAHVPPSPSPSRDKGPKVPVERAKRHRLALIGLIAIACLVGLVVGLVLGLRKGSKEKNIVSNGDDDDSDDGNAPAPLLFPAGSYAFATALYTASTACTSDPRAFRCFPFTTYNASQAGTASAALTTYLWTIRDTGAAEYAISSSAPGRASVPQFRDVPLALADANQDPERLVFSFPMAIAVELQLDVGQLVTATCYYNDTTMSATLWTRRPAEYPRGGLAGNGTRAGEDFDPWPYAVEVAQVVRPGPGVPDCRDAGGNRVEGNLTVEGGVGECACRYKNFGLGI